jgi:hypothetical protein
MVLDPALLAVVKALEPYLDDVVIVGGWVPYLYGLQETPTSEAVSLKTRDVDLAVSRRVAQRAKPIDHLLEEAGFACEFRSVGTPPVTAYVRKRRGEETEVEFITTAKGAVEACGSCRTV